MSTKALHATQATSQDFERSAISSNQSQQSTVLQENLTPIQDVQSEFTTFSAPVSYIRSFTNAGSFHSARSLHQTIEVYIWMLTSPNTFATLSLTLLRTIPDSYHRLTQKSVSIQESSHQIHFI